MITYYMFILKLTGEQSIVLPSDLAAAEIESRPSSAKSDISTERPTSSSSSHTGAIIGNARVRLREVEEENANEPENPTSTDNDNSNDDVAKSSSSNPIISQEKQTPMKDPPIDNEEKPVINDNDDASNPKAKSQMYQLQGNAPPTETKFNDIVDEIPENVISRPGTPGTWAFDEKEPSLHTKPPRPTSANLCSPPIPRKAPVSVDHHLRK